MNKTIDQLCYFAALTRSGLTDEVLRNVVSFLCAIRQSTFSISDIQQVLQDDFHLRQPLPAIQVAADSAVECGWLVVDNQKYNSTESGKSMLLASRSKFEELEGVVRGQWIQSAEDVFGSLEDADVLWGGVRAQLAVLAFKHGSTTASLLSADSDFQPAVESLRSELLAATNDKCNEFGPEIILASLTCFLELETPESTNFIEQLLSSAFSYSALTIAVDASEYLTASLKSLDIFLDTNFIFGLLEWHDSPQNQVCQELIRITKENKLPFKYYYFEDTLKELVDWLDSQARIWLKGQFPPGISRAIISAEGVPLFVRRYHEENATEPLSVEMYLDRFLNVGAILGSLGLTIFREPEQDAEHVRTWGERQASYGDFLQTRPKWKERSTSSLRHDAVLLGIVDRRRESGVSPLTSGCLLLTVDSHLIAFSRERAAENGNRSLVLYPSQFMQLIMPFIVHSERNSRVLAESINVAVFQTIQFDRQRAIIAVTNHIRNIKNLSEEDAKRILSNQILISKLSLSSDDEAAELVESALAAQTAEARVGQAEAEAELELIREENERMSIQINQKHTQSTTLASKLSKESQEKGALRQTVQELHQKIQAFEDQRESERNQRKKSQEMAFAGILFLFAVGVWAIPFSSIPFLAMYANILSLRLTLTLAFVLLALGFAIPKARFWMFGAVGIDILLGLIQSVTSKTL
jgi:hypothetical protein